ncbi:MAG: Crp/Fnr family transcriptional regulator [bacterium]
MFGNKLERYRREYRTDEVIFQEDDWGNNLLVVDDGKVQIEKEMNGSRQVVATVESGEIIGEMVFASGDNRRTATARAITDVSGWKLNEDQVEALLEQNETFREKLYTLLTRRLERTTEKLTELLELKDRQIQIVLLLTALLDETELSGEDELSKTLSVTPEFMAYTYRTTYERFERLMKDHAGGTRPEIDSEELEANREAADRVLRELTDNLRLRVPDSLTEEPDVRESILKTLRGLEDSLEELSDPDGSFSRQQFSSLKQNHSKAQKLLKEYKKVNSSTTLEMEMKQTLNSINKKLRKFNPEDFDEG